MDEFQTITPPSGLDDVLGSAARTRVARLLVELPDKEFTGREVARLLRMSHTTVLSALRVLTDRGLINERVLGRAHVFRVNRGYFLYNTLAVLFRSERRQGRDVTDLIRSFLRASSTSVILFGSRARKTPRRSSDVDLLVVSKNVHDTEEALSQLHAELRRRFGLELDAKVLTAEQLRSKLGAPFVRAALAEGFVIEGVPLEKVRETGT